ncbi:MAG: alpha-amylase family glycosyl hydrolase [Faecalibacterium sp.]
MAWYDNAVFYHIYPLGLCGCKHENDGQPTPGAFQKLNDWAAHAAELGCTAIYIGPLFESGTHGYDTVDYRLVDRRLGTNQAFRAFVDACHARGQRVIVDGVFNHVSREFFAFRDLKEHREHARYRDWFCDVNFWGNNEYNDGFSYGNWGGFNLLVKLNQRNPEVQQYHFDTVRFWVEQFDIDGIRLDAADVMDFGFMEGLRRVSDELKPDFWLLGEVIHGDYSRWANPRMLHSVTNYELHKGLWSGHNDHNYFEIAHTMRRLQGMCGKTRLYSFSDNHDVERLPNKLRNKEHIRHIAILVYTLWGVPSIYYGSEFAVEGKKEWGSDWPLRPCLKLADYEGYLEKDPVTSVYAALGRLKAERPELSEGEAKELKLTTRAYAFARVLGDQACVVVMNNDDAPLEMEFPLPVDAAGAEDLLADCAGSQPVEALVEWGRIKVKLPANYATILGLTR